MPPGVAPLRRPVPETAPTMDEQWRELLAWARAKSSRELAEALLRMGRRIRDYTVGERQALLAEAARRLTAAERAAGGAHRKPKPTRS